MEEKKAGTVEKYFGNLKVAVIRLSDEIQPGDRLHFRGKSDFEQILGSMEVNSKRTQVAGEGSQVGVVVDKPCYRGDEVFRVKED
ncbi:MAG: hypothetical protein ACOCZ6_03345 [Nanoarchaeota archaeon]